ncbi:hypothetical protein [Dictyobacter halimunensis]|uniref:hypothetical protein n=1 Tax=Dictyobacter halimunensis TaxID=3026934 RepID=UPI0030C71969
MIHIIFLSLYGTLSVVMEKTLEFFTRVSLSRWVLAHMACLEHPTRPMPLPRFQHVDAALQRVRAFAASAPGFLGHALHLYRQRTGLSSAQQRALLGLHNASTDALWTRLQAMPLPRPDHFDVDLQRIVADILTSFPDHTIHTALVRFL